jgi:acyl carrier protein
LFAEIDLNKPNSMCDLLSIENKVFEYVRKNTFSDKHEITSKTLIFSEGIFDSMAFVLLIDFIEGNFGIKLGDEDLLEENFKSIDAITKYIHRKKESTS